MSLYCTPLQSRTCTAHYIGTLYIVACIYPNSYVFTLLFIYNNNHVSCRLQFLPLVIMYMSRPAVNGCMKVSLYRWSLNMHAVNSIALQKGHPI